MKGVGVEGHEDGQGKDKTEQKRNPTEEEETQSSRSMPGKETVVLYSTLAVQYTLTVAAALKKKHIKNVQNIRPLNYFNTMNRIVCLLVFGKISS